jgi:hypothetical protein
MADYPISNVPRRIQYVNTGVGPYLFNFEILVATDIAVYRGNNLLALTADYTVTINSNGTGSVTLTTAGTGNITIVGARAIQRSSDYTTGGDLFANTLNTDLDSQTIFSQQVAESLARSIKGSVTDATSLNMNLPDSASRANKLLGFNSNGEPITSNATVNQLDAAVSSFVNATGNNAASILYDPEGSGAVTTTVQAKLRQSFSPDDFGVANASTLQQSLDQVKIKTDNRTYRIPQQVFGQITVSNKAWNFATDPVFGRSTPQSALISFGGHYDEYGSAGRNYQWGISSWITNPGTMPITNIDGVAQGWKVRAGGMAARQCGDGGDGHALEILSGQWAARATVTTTNGSDTLAVSAVTFRGSKFCIGNTISGTNIPGGATIISVTKGSQTITANAVETMTVVSGGTGYVVGDIVSLVGGTSTITAQARVMTVASGGAISTLLVIEGGNYTVNPAGTLNLSGGSGSGATVTVTIINGGLGYPDSIKISAVATGTGTSDITVLGTNNLNIGILVTGSGDGGLDGTGNPGGVGIAFQSFNNAAFYRGVNFGASALRADGTGIRFASGTAQRGISFESYSLEQAFRVSGGIFTNIIQTTDVTCTGSVISFGSTTATNGINFASTNVFSGAAILLSGQNIDTDLTTGMKIGLGPTRKIGFWNATPVIQPSAIPNAAGGTEVATINSILTALRNIGLIAT